MPYALPVSLGRLLEASDPVEQEDRWGEFISAHSRLILHVARSIGGEHDAGMDRYAFVLEQLRRDNFRRLRAYVADGRSEFSTWLVVVAQRLCRDHERQRYGRRMRSRNDTSADDHAARRRLVDLIGSDIDPSSLIDANSSNAELVVRSFDVQTALENALSELGPQDRLLLKLRFEDDLPMPEVAENLGFPTRFHAYRRLKEILSVLRGALERRGIEDAVP